MKKLIFVMVILSLAFFCAYCSEAWSMKITSVEGDCISGGRLMIKGEGFNERGGQPRAAEVKLIKLQGRIRTLTLTKEDWQPKQITVRIPKIGYYGFLRDSPDAEIEVTGPGRHKVTYRKPFTAPKSGQAAGSNICPGPVEWLDETKGKTVTEKEEFKHRWGWDTEWERKYFEGVGQGPLPYKSLLLNETDKVTVKLDPPQRYSNITFACSDEKKVRIEKVDVGYAQTRLTLRGVGLTEYQKPVEIHATCDGKEIGLIRVMVYRGITKTLAMMDVKRPGEASFQSKVYTDDSVTEATLNEIYRQAGVTWRVRRLSPMTEVDYDYKPKDDRLHIGSIEKDKTGRVKWPTDEQKTIIDRCKNDSTCNNVEIHANLFTTLCYASDETALGEMEHFQRYGFLFARNPGKVQMGPKAQASTVAHELGHGVFGLVHHSGSKQITFRPSFKYLMERDIVSEGSWKLSPVEWDYINHPKEYQRMLKLQRITDVKK